MDDAQPWNSKERYDQYESLFPLLPDYVAHYTLGGSRGPAIGLPSKDALRLAKDIQAVIIADFAGLSVPYARKQYVEDATKWRWLGLTERIDKIYQAGSNALETFARLSLESQKNEDSFQDLSVQFFYRNLASFDAAKRLSELGYLCEVAVILRASLEQFAFSEDLWQRTGKENLASLKPLRSLNWLMKQRPGLRRLNGLLSKYVHFEFEHHSHFFVWSPTRNFTVQRSPVLRAYATLLLFITMSVICDQTRESASKRLTSETKLAADLDAFVQTVDKFCDDVCLMLPTDIPLAEFDILLQSLAKKTES